MATVSVLNMEGKEVEKLELNDNIFPAFTGRSDGCIS